MATLELNSNSKTEANETTTMESEESVVLFLLGKTGHGKSTTGNAILGREVFEASDGSSSVTFDVQVGYCRRENRIIKVVDGPGTYETRLERSKAAKKMTEDMSKGITMCTEGIDALLLVFSYGSRFTEEELHTVEMLKSMFGESFVKDYCILVLTHGENFIAHNRRKHTPDKTFQAWCKEQEGKFQTLLQECDYRAVLFHNMSPEIEDSQRQELLSIVNNLKSQGVRYTNEAFAKAAKFREELIVRENAPEFRGRIQEKLVLLIDGLESLQDKSELNDEAWKLIENLKEDAKELDATVDYEDKGTGVLDSLKLLICNLSQSINSFEKAVQESEKIKTMESELATRRHECEQTVSELKSKRRKKGGENKWKDMQDERTGMDGGSQCRQGGKSKENYEQDAREKATKSQHEDSMDVDNQSTNSVQEQLPHNTLAIKENIQEHKKVMATAQQQDKQSIADEKDVLKKPKAQSKFNMPAFMKKMKKTKKGMATAQQQDDQNIAVRKDVLKKPEAQSELNDEVAVKGEGTGKLNSLRPNVSENLKDVHDERIRTDVSGCPKDLNESNEHLNKSIENYEQDAREKATKSQHEDSMDVDNQSTNSVQEQLPHNTLAIKENIQEHKKVMATAQQQDDQNIAVRKDVLKKPEAQSELNDEVAVKGEGTGKLNSLRPNVSENLKDVHDERIRTDVSGCPKDLNESNEHLNKSIENYEQDAREKATKSQHEDSMDVDNQSTNSVQKQLPHNTPALKEDIKEHKKVMGTAQRQNDRSIADAKEVLKKTEAQSALNDEVAVKGEGTGKLNSPRPDVDRTKSPEIMLREIEQSKNRLKVEINKAEEKKAKLFQDTPNFFQ